MSKHDVDWDSIAFWGFFMVASVVAMICLTVLMVTGVLSTPCITG